jgi:hypothetical protein
MSTKHLVNSTLREVTSQFTECVRSVKWLPATLAGYSAEQYPP